MLSSNFCDIVHCTTHGNDIVFKFFYSKLWNSFVELIMTSTCNQEDDTRLIAFTTRSFQELISAIQHAYQIPTKFRNFSTKYCNFPSLKSSHCTEHRIHCHITFRSQEQTSFVHSNFIPQRQR